MRPVSASPIQEIILWAPLLGVLMFAAIMRHPKMEHSYIKRWLHQTTLIPSYFHPFFRSHPTISPLLSLSLSSTLAFCIAGLLPLCLRAAYLATEFPVWSLGYRNSGVEAKGGRTLGEMNFFTLAFVMLPVTHTSILGYLTGISMERAIVYHRIWARLTIVIMGMHGIWMWVAFGTVSSSIPPITPENVGYPFIIRNEIKPFSFVLQMSRDSVTGWSNLSGALAFLCFAGMGVTSLPYFRRKLFETFHATHLFLALLGFIFAFLHMPAIARYAAPAWALYALDLCLRLYRAHRWHGMAEIIPLESGITRVIVHLKKKQKLEFEAGQYAFLRIPTLSYFQNHPFSISSSPHSDTITFHILAMGKDKTWTSRLRMLRNTHVKDVEANISNRVTCYVDGAYGIPAIRHFSYPTLVLVCGGIGITPAASIISYLLQSTLTTSSSSISTSVSRIILIWTVSNRSVFETFDDMLTQSHSCSAVELNLYNTDRKHQEMVQVTNRANEDKMDVTLEKQQGSWKDHIKSGRPNMPSILTEIARLHDPSQVAVMACGPEPLVLTTRDVCHDLNLAFHRETFLL